MASINAAIWLGASVFLTAAVGPAFFSEGMLNLMPRETAGKVAQLVLARYFLLLQILGATGLGLLFLESRIAPNRSHRRRLALLATLVGLGLVGGYGFQPVLKELHQIRYASETAPEVREAAKRRFGMLHGISQSVNLAMLVGVLVHFSWTIRPTHSASNGTNSGEEEWMSS